jgi:CCR4-NOT complex subunit CAF16
MSLGKVKKWGSVEEMDVKVEQGERMYTGNSQLGELVLKWLQEDLTERGPRNGKGEGATYQSLEGKGGYGAEKRVEDK